jgi:pimeloyl-ACP methyl ester carboxylesterase
MTLPRCARQVTVEAKSGPLTALEAVPPDPSGSDGGAAGRPPVVVFVPGFTGSKEDFLPLLEPVAEAGLRMLALDQRGQCDSPGLDDPAGYSLAGFAEDLRAVLDVAAAGAGDGSAQQAAVHLVGHSFGGLVARNMLLTGPVPGFLRSLTILDSGPAGAVGKARERVELFLQVSQELTLLEINQIEPMDQHPDPEVSAFLLHRWLSNDPVSLRAMATALTTEPDRTEELRDLLRRTGLPCFLAAGEDEDVWPCALQRETAERLGVPFAAIPGAAHSPNTQNPDGLIKALLDFWL